MTISQLVTQLREAALQSDAADAPPVKQLQETLAERGDEAVKELAPLLRDSDMRVSEAAADVLQKIASEAAYDEMVAYTLRHLDDPTGQTKLPGPGWRRLRLLGKAALPAMRRAYKPELPFATRHTMILITHQVADSAGLPLLEAALAESDPRLVESAAEALGSVGGPAAYNRLVQLLDSKDAQHRAGAIRGLGLLGNLAAVEPLLNVLLSKDSRYQGWGSGASESAMTLHRIAAEVIDALAGEQLNGDAERIRDWLRKRPQNPGG
jgi:HEAT repeat protein